MPKKTPVAKAEQVDLERLTQAQAAWLLGKPAVWLRDNAHHFSRDEDGTYDGRELIAVARSELVSANLPDAVLEPVLQLAWDLLEPCEFTRPAVIGLIERIQQRHGAAGMAAITDEFLRALREQEDMLGPHPLSDDLSEEFRNRRTVLVCEQCNRHRWGRTWRADVPPAGHVQVRHMCPSCYADEKKQANRKQLPQSQVS